MLEVGCGTGRILIPTARAGIEIVGLDLSPHMLAVCRERLLKEPSEVQARVQLIEADMRQFSLGQVFKLVTEGTLEEKIAAIIEKKRNLMDSVVKEDDPGLLKTFTRAQLIEMLSIPARG